MVVHIQPFLLFAEILLHKRHNMTLKIFSIFTFFRQNPASFSHCPIFLPIKITFPRI